MKQPEILAVCGKGGAGKTVVSALLSRAIIRSGGGPLLLVDADPAGGLGAAIGERAARTLADVRNGLVAAARTSGRSEALRLAEQVDYLLLEALVERRDYSFLAMGRPLEQGCYCPVNTLLREAIDALAASFAVVLIDAEAGLEQINRQVTRRLTMALAVVDGSRRSAETARVIAEMVGRGRVRAILNRAPRDTHGAALPEGLPLAGTIPEDVTVACYDRGGRPLWELPDENEAVEAARGIALALGLVTEAASGPSREARHGD